MENADNLNLLANVAGDEGAAVKVAVEVVAEGEVGPHTPPGSPGVHFVHWMEIEGLRNWLEDVRVAQQEGRRIPAPDVGQSVDALLRMRFGPLWEMDCVKGWGIVIIDYLEAVRQGFEMISSSARTMMERVLQSAEPEEWLGQVDGLANEGGFIIDDEPGSPGPQRESSPVPGPSWA